MPEPNPQNPQPLAGLDLRDPALLPQLQRELDHHIMQNNQRGAYWIARGIRELAKRDSTLRVDRPEVFARAQQTLNLALWASLSWWPEREVKQLFENGVREAFDASDLDVWDQTRGFLTVITSLEDRTRVKRELREALLRNSQPFSEVGLVLQGKRQTGTIGNWLRYYLATVGADPASTIALASFLTKDALVLKLNLAERKIFDQLVRLFERLKRPSDTIEGVENPVAIDALDDEDRIGVFRDGVFEELDRRPLKDLAWAQELHDRIAGVKTVDFDQLAEYLEPVTQPPSRLLEPSPQSPLPVSAARERPGGVPLDVPTQQIMAAYQWAVAFEQSVVQEVAGLKQAAGSGSDKLRAAFFAAVQAKQVPRTIAALRLMAEQGEFERMLADDARLRRHLLAAWPDLYGATAAVQFGEHPTTRQSVRLFIQYVLQERLGISEPEAARMGAQLGNLFRQHGHPELGALAYYDVAEGKFRWME